MNAKVRMKPMNNELILVVEDDEPKQRSIIGFLRDTLGTDIEILAAGSLNSAVKLLSTRMVRLAVVDMSLPTFDSATDRSGGGHPLGFGGADILRFIQSETAETLSVVLTQYEEFTLSKDGIHRDISELDAALKEELGERFFGVIHYSGQHGDWRTKLASVLEYAGLIGKL